MPKSKDKFLDSKINNALTGSNPEIALNSLIDEITNPNQKGTFTEESLNSLQTQLLEQIDHSSHLNAEKKDELKQTVESKMKEKKDLLWKTSSELDQLAGWVNGRTGNDESAVESQEPSFWSKAGSFVSENWDAMFDKEKWRTETWKNALRVAGFLGTWVGVLKWLWGIWKWCGRKIKGLFSSKEKTIERKQKELAELYQIGPDNRNNEQKNRANTLINEISKLNNNKDSNDGEHGGHSDDKEENPWFFGKVWNWIKWTLGIWAVGTAVWYAASDTFRGKVNNFFWNLWDKITGKETLPLDQASKYAESVILNQTHHDKMKSSLNYRYDKDKHEVLAFWHTIKIDEENKKIDGLDITFDKYEDLFVAAILINYLKYTYAGICQNDKPFLYEWDASWDITVNIDNSNEEAVSWTWNAWKIIGWTVASVLSVIGWFSSKSPKVWLTIAWVAIPAWVAIWAVADGKNFLNKCCSSLDSEIAKQKLAVYLNEQWDWETWNQNVDHVSESEIRQPIIDVIHAIEQTANATVRGKQRNLNAIPDPNNPHKLMISSYNFEVPVTLSDDKKNLTLEEVGITVPLEEWIYLANNINFLKRKYEKDLIEDIDNKWNKVGKYFYYDEKRSRYIRNKGKQWKWIYCRNGEHFSDWMSDTLVLDNKDTNNKYPTFFSNQNIQDTYLKYLNWLTDENWKSIRVGSKTHEVRDDETTLLQQAA